MKKIFSMFIIFLSIFSLNFSKPSIFTKKEIEPIKAKKIALSKVPGATFANVLEFEKENDFYKGEIKYRNVTYNFRINSNGKIVEWKENETQEKMEETN
ncbi:PepSY domain-containing protein [Leptotrichia sp. oral taxon 847]|uniref:PepSY domain-containing protein n=1 Tax=Leptotrichia sp. oral taxon 847 TaxID=1785996 RepID=UPI000767FDEE|nr:PepSY domain-containing protein [Leptotrichia sp. oral taxon 847]AMD95775.1 hypothetical protein AXF11_09440 [Leptotrichia sp. oral taxon 847]